LPDVSRAAENDDSVLWPFSDDDYQVREAQTADAEGILTLVAALDMTNATSFVWPLDELRERLRQRRPLVVLAQHRVSGAIAGVAGIDVWGMEKDFMVLSIGSRSTTCPVGEVFTVPANASLCRGLLVHPEHQGAGLGSRLHKARIVLVATVAPHAAYVVLSARGRTLEEAKVALRPVLERDNSEPGEPQVDKSTVFQFTYPTSKGVVHLAHQRESEGMQFVGVDVSDGGPVWITTQPLAELAVQYAAARSRGTSAAMSVAGRLPCSTLLTVQRPRNDCLSG
jgi:GNAT superfamily N-acetyltransferase